MGWLVVPLCGQDVWFAFSATEEVELVRLEMGVINVMSVKTLYKVVDARACLELQLTSNLFVVSLQMLDNE